MKRKQGAQKNGKAVMQKQAQEEAEGKAVKQKQREAEDGMAMHQNEEEGEGKEKESKGKEKMELEIKTVMLRCADNIIVPVDWEVAKQFETVNLFEMDPAQIAESDPPFLLENVSADVLAIVIEFCRFHVSPDTNLGPPPHRPKKTTNTQYIRQQRIRDWETDFLQRLDLNTIFSLMQAANYLNIQVLLDASSEFIVQKILNSSLEEVREMLNLVNDLTPDQQAAERKEFAWILAD